MARRKRTMAETEALYESAERNATAQAIVLRAIFNGEGSDASEVALYDGAKYTFNLYSATGANGGIVVILFDSPHNAAISVECRYLDSVSYPMLTEYLPLNIAIERLKNARAALWRAEDGDKVQA